MRSLVVLPPEPSESDSILVELVEDSPIVSIGVLPCLPGLASTIKFHPRIGNSASSVCPAVES